MKLNFTQGKDNSSVSRWNNILVILKSGELGELDVMFTGHNKKATVLFAKLIPENTLLLDSDGFSCSGSMCTTTATGRVVESNRYIWITPGLMQPFLYVANRVNGQSDPYLSGKFYATYFKDSEKCVGVDDPSLFNAFVEKYNKQFIDHIKSAAIQVGQYYFSNYWGKSLLVKVQTVRTWKAGVAKRAYRHDPTDDLEREYDITLDNWTLLKEHTLTANLFDGSQVTLNIPVELELFSSEKIKEHYKHIPIATIPFYDRG